MYTKVRIMGIPEEHERDRKEQKMISKEAMAKIIPKMMKIYVHISKLNELRAG